MGTNKNWLIDWLKRHLSFVKKYINRTKLSQLIFVILGKQPKEKMSIRGQARIVNVTKKQTNKQTEDVREDTALNWTMYWATQNETANNDCKCCWDWLNKV